MFGRPRAWPGLAWTGRRPNNSIGLAAFLLNQMPYNVGWRPVGEAPFDLLDTVSQVLDVPRGRRRP